jgi:hypothetical protein
MSTRAIIGKINNSDSLEYIYLQRDGHPHTAGKVLSKYYTTDAMNKRLFSLGNLSVLEETVGSCIAYNEPKTVTKCKPSEAAQLLCTVAKKFAADFAYLFIDDSWRCWKIALNGQATEIPLLVHEESGDLSDKEIDEDMIDTMIGDLMYIRGQVEAIKQVTAGRIPMIEMFLSNICRASENIETHMNILKNNP